jgi:O-acetyl-ADP-ribose deacetylase (regulator of RNase III)
MLDDIESEFVPEAYKVPGTRAHISIMNKESLFDSRMQTIVIPVNCVGVMGAGLARRAALTYPGLEDAYMKRAGQGAVKIGWLFTYDSDDHRILLFPTKEHWKNDSLLTSIVRGCRTLVRNYQDMGIESIAIPALGCGLGKLPFKDVLSVIYEAAEMMGIDAEIYPPLP